MTNDIVRALSQDDSMLDEIAARIRHEHSSVVDSAYSTTMHAVYCGELLLDAKRRVGHGNWGNWLRDFCDLSERTAQDYMRMARQRAANPQRAVDLTTRCSDPAEMAERRTKNVNPVYWTIVCR